jgi:chemotaxis protein methyltransferase CheR
VLSADKHYLVESRLLPIARKPACSISPGLVAQAPRAPDSEPLTVEVVEAMTTNESFFFRDKIPFEHFRDTMIPALIAARATTAAAFASGAPPPPPARSPYTLAISLKELGPGAEGLAGSRSSRPTFPPKCWRRPRAASTPSSKCSAACRC